MLTQSSVAPATKRLSVSCDSVSTHSGYCSVVYRHSMTTKVKEIRPSLRQSFSKHPKNSGSSTESYAYVKRRVRNRDLKIFQSLVAQSVVGREGLNLYESCRTAMLLHPDCNPEVVEQQIGWVDSLWQQKLQQFIDNRLERSNPPRIDIHSVVLKGT